MRRGGTPTAFANAVCDSAIGFRNSSIRISPGWGFRRSSVVVDDFDLVCIAFTPHEAYPPLIIDADRILSAPLAFQRFQPIGRRRPQIVALARIVQQTKLAQCRRLNVRRQPAALLARPNRRGRVVTETDDHREVITQNVMRYNKNSTSGT